jgi:hypothetical protein
MPRSEQFDTKTRNVLRRFQLLRFLILVPAFLILVPATIAIGLACIGIMLLQIFEVSGPQSFVLCVLIWIGWVLLFMAMIALHELGHALAAVSVRWHILQVRVGAFVLVRQGGIFSLRFTSKRSSQPAYVLVCPADTRRYFLKACIFSSGGVVANLVIALVCTLLLLSQTAFLDDFNHKGYKAIIQIFLPTDNWVAALLGSTVLVNLFFVVTNLIPINNSLLPSDGKQLIGVLVSWLFGVAPPVIQRPGLGGMLFYGVRPRKWDAECVMRLQSPTEDAATGARGGLFGYYYALDRGQPEQAGELLDRALVSVAEAQGTDRSAILLEAAYFEGFHRQNPVVARKWLHQVKINELREYTFLRGAAAVLLAEGLFADAAASVKAALAQVKRSIDFGGVQAEKDWLKAILATCRERIKQEEAEETAAS